MKTFSKLAGAATLVLASVGSAQAAEEDSLFFLANTYENTVGTLAQYYAVSNQGVAGDSVANRVAGDTFIDDFFLPLSEGDSFSLSLSATGVVFDSVAFYDFTGGVYDFASASLSGGSFLGTGLSLISGLYALEVVGTIGVDAGTYGGALFNAAAVPEPQEWAMLLAGLGLVGCFGRKRVKTIG